MSRWFRFYDGALDDPKVQRLSGDLFKTWVNLLCVASRHNGRLPPTEDLAFLLRLDVDAAEGRLRSLIEHGLIDDEDGVLAPHNWAGRQHKSDDSNERVRRFREKRKRDGNGDVTVTATPPETETDTDKSSEANASADVPPAPNPLTPKDRIWAKAPVLAVLANRSEGSIRSYLGKCLAEFPPEAVEAAVGVAIAENSGDPCGLITRTLKPAENRRRNPTGPPQRPPTATDVLASIIHRTQAHLGNAANERSTRQPNYDEIIPPDRRIAGSR